MRRSRLGVLAVLAVAAAVVAVVAQWALASAGAVKLVPQVPLAATLVVIAAAVLALAWPVRRATRGRAESGAPRSAVDPFYATRVLLIAKASAVTGALLGGAGAGFAIEILLRQVAGAGTGLWASVATAVGGAALLIVGRVAEGWCAVPPGDDGVSEDVSAG